jgi:hypothetical protein
MTKKLTFIPSSEEVSLVVPAPVPSKNVLPEWFKKIPAPTRTLQNDPNNNLGISLKGCVPFLDSLTAGYMQLTHSEFTINVEDEQLLFHQSSVPKVLDHRPTPGRDIPSQYYNIEFLWIQSYIIKVPKGYSVLIVHPLNRDDLPFVTQSGIIDSDEFHHVANGKIPVYFKKGFTGVIPIGTPMFQIIPFKREDWESEKGEYSQNAEIKKRHELNKYLFDSYRRQWWQKKKYT